MSTTAAALTLAGTATTGSQFTGFSRKGKEPDILPYVPGGGPSHAVDQEAHQVEEEAHMVEVEEARQEAEASSLLEAHKYQEEEEEEN